MKLSRYQPLWVGLLLILALAAGSTLRAMPTSDFVWKQLPDLPDREGFASPFAGVSHGALLVAGGANFPEKRPWEGGAKAWYDTIFLLSSPGAQWRAAGRLPRPLAYGVSFTTERGVVCVGGGDAHEHTRDAFLLSWDGREVQTSKLPSLPAPIAFGSGAGAGNQLYLLGGLDRPDETEALTTFLRLDLAAAEPRWVELPPLPGPGRMLAQVGVSDGRVYVCGGVSLEADAQGKPRRTYLRDGYVYEEKTGWRKIADLPHAVAAAPSPMPVTPAGELLVISGDDGERGHLIGPNHPGFPQEVFAYDPAHDAWRRGADAPLSRATAPTTRWQEGWIIASGERKPGYRSPEVWSLHFSP